MQRAILRGIQKGVVHDQHSARWQRGVRAFQKRADFRLGPVVQHIREKVRVCLRWNFICKHVARHHANPIRKPALFNRPPRDAIHRRLLHHRAPQVGMVRQQRTRIDGGAPADIQQVPVSRKIQRLRQNLRKINPPAIHRRRELRGERFRFHGRMPVIDFLLAAPVRRPVSAHHFQQVLGYGTIFQRSVIRPHEPGRLSHEMFARHRRQP